MSAIKTYSLLHLKTALMSEFTDPKVLYYYGSWWPLIHHPHLTIGYNKLNYDLHFNVHVKKIPSCLCGALIEDANHFLLECSNYNDLRLQLFNCVSSYCDVTLDTILFDNDQLLVFNQAIFSAVHHHIEKSDRFLWVPYNASPLPTLPPSLCSPPPNARDL